MRVGTHGMAVACAVALLAGCVEVAAQPAASVLEQCVIDAGVDAPVAQPAPCPASDILVLLDRSSSMVDHPFAPHWHLAARWLTRALGGHDARAPKVLARWPTNFDVAQRIVQRVVAAAASDSAAHPGDPPIDVRIIGFPAPGADLRCEASSPTAAAEALAWPAPGRHGNQTPLEAALEAAAAAVAGNPRARPSRILLLTDGKQDCGGRRREYSQEALAEHLASRAATAGLSIAGGEAVVFDAPVATADAVQRALDKLFPQRCHLVAAPPPPAAPAPPISPHPYPDVVAVGGDGRWPCAGVLLAVPPGAGAVAGRYVLTARHCLPAAAVALVATSSAPAPTIAVAATIGHPDPAVDAAILVLARPPMRPTHRARSAADRLPPAGVIRVVGLGADDAGGAHGAGDLHIVDLPANGWGCEGRAGAALGCRAGFEFAVRGNGGHDACRGDSGGPAFERTPCGWRLIGIVSRAIPSSRRACGDGGIYTRIDAIAPWIDEVIATANQGLRP